jgi:anti-anti-sigma factor
MVDLDNRELEIENRARGDGGHPQKWWTSMTKGSGTRPTDGHPRGQRLAHGVSWSITSTGAEGGSGTVVPTQGAAAVDVDPALVIRLAGEFDMSTAPDLRAALDLVLRLSCIVLVLDLRRVTFADAAFVRVVQEARAAVRLSGGELCIINARPAVARVLRLCRIPHQPSVPRYGPP